MESASHSLHTGNETTSDVFALVRRYNDGNWYLDRILSGPGIPLQ